jgi:hypothetical protein
MDPKIYFSQGARHFSLELIKLYILYPARTSTGRLEERITATTMRRYEIPPLSGQNVSPIHSQRPIAAAGGSS